MKKTNELFYLKKFDLPGYFEFFKVFYLENPKLLNFDYNDVKAKLKEISEENFSHLQL